MCSIALMTSCRCVLSRATTRHSRSRSRHAVHLEHLGDAFQPGDGLLEATLDDLERHEREHGITHLRRLDLGAEAGDHAARRELVHPRLHRPARHAEAPGDLHHADPRVGAQHQQQPASSSSISSDTTRETRAYPGGSGRIISAQERLDEQRVPQHPRSGRWLARRRSGARARGRAGSRSARSSHAVDGDPAASRRRAAGLRRRPAAQRGRQPLRRVLRHAAGRCPRT